MTQKQAAPPHTVLAAFGAEGEPEPLVGGRGQTWQAGDLVFKPADLTPDELAWHADVLPTIEVGNVRLSFPRRTVHGELVIDGWTAWSLLAGEHRSGRWLDAIAAGDRLHDALAGFDRPAFLDARTDPWAIGDRVAWGEAPVEPYRHVRHIDRLVDRLEPVEARGRLIHGDLTGNVLFADGLPPAVIDLSLYWRPAPFATAIVVADALVWEGAGESLAESVADVVDVGQLLLRALLFRLVAAVEGGFEDDDAAIERRYARTVDLALRLVT